VPDDVLDTAASACNASLESLCQLRSEAIIMTGTGTFRAASMLVAAACRPQICNMHALVCISKIRNSASARCADTYRRVLRHMSGSLLNHLQNGVDLLGHLRPLSVWMCSLSCLNLLGQGYCPLQAPFKALHDIASDLGRHCSSGVRCRRHDNSVADSAPAQPCKSRRVCQGYASCV
jgi:hypothetical protein